MSRLNADDQQKLDRLFEQLCLQKETYVGYPNSGLLEGDEIARFLTLPLNNVGDPFEGNNGIHSCEFEQEVVRFYSSVLNLPHGRAWGYVTTGGTEGNLFGLYLGRERFPGGVLYHTKESHYSVAKAGRLLNMPRVLVRSNENGEMDLEHLRQMTEGLRHYPAIICANIGTTMKGAIDSVEGIERCLSAVGIEDYHIHCDAALFGGMLPFLDDAPLFDFSLPIGSLSLSGHKFIGSPIPCGLVLTREDYKTAVQGAVAYIGSTDATISGSRGGFSSLLLWHCVKRFGFEGYRALARESMVLTDYALKELKKISYPAWANEYSNIVVLRRPSPDMVKKWQLATEGEWSHLIAMPGMTRLQVDRFIRDLCREVFQKGLVA